MLGISLHLADIWLFIIGFFLLYYAVADGADLGVGIISLGARGEPERASMMAALEPVWHDNQTWLVLLGGMMFGAFPVFYALLLSALYVPILVMLFGLVLRGVSFEFRHNSRRKALWGWAFGAGSLIAALAQGFAFGGLLAGLELRDGRFVGQVWGWSNPFAALVAAGVVVGYTMLGANYLILKARGPVLERGYRIARAASLVTLVISSSVHLWVIARYPKVTATWAASGLAGSLHLAVFPALAAASFLLYFRSLLKRQEGTPLLWNAAIVLFSFVGLSVYLYPDMIPNVISSPVTVQAAAASPKTLRFMLAVTAVLLPLILAYTGYKHWIFRGKAGGDL
ncbi:MAG: cytochrome d ubiquinol oxidase subunit II [bacterium]